MREIKITKKSDRELLLEIRGEDHTLGNLIAKEALKHTDIEYAAYRIPHPLQDKLEIYIVVKKGRDPKKVLIEVCEQIKKYLQEFNKLVEEKISET